MTMAVIQITTFLFLVRVVIILGLVLCKTRRKVLVLVLSKTRRKVYEVYVRASLCQEQLHHQEQLLYDIILRFEEI